MSNIGLRLRERAREMRERDSKQRRNWNPQPGTFHHRLYHKSWRRATNFCQYWRIVLWQAVIETLKNRVVQVIAGFAGILFLAWILYQMGGPETILLIPALVIYFTVGLGVTTLFYVEFIKPEVLEDLEDEPVVGRFAKMDEGPRYGMYFLASPIIVAAFIIGMPCFAAIVFLGWVFVEKELWFKLTYVFLEAHPRYGLISWMRLWMILPGAVLVLAPFYGWALITVLIIGGVLALFGLITAAGWTVETVRYNQKLREEERIKERSIIVLRELHGRIHIKKRGDEEHFQRWLKRYTRYMIRKHRLESEEEFWRLNVYTHFRQHRIAFPAYLQPVAPSSTRPPSKLKRFIRGIGDFFAFVWAIVLTRKWKVCPLLDIPDNQED